jgi:spore coat polysaccharide biosynthesis protein SpsF
MKIVATIQARMSSVRLPKKVMANIYENLNTIEIIVRRVKRSKLIDDIIVATTNHQSDNKLVNFLKKKNINYYRGSQNNVLSRVVSAARKYKPHLLVQLTGDNPVVDYEIIDYMVGYFKKNYSKFDYITNNGLSNLSNRQIPLGLDVSVIKFASLNKVRDLVKRKDAKEHPSLYFYREGKKKFRILNLKMKPEWINKNLRLTLDTQEDLSFFKKLFKKLHKNKGAYFLTKDILNLQMTNKKIFLINNNVKQKLPEGIK